MLENLKAFFRFLYLLFGRILVELVEHHVPCDYCNGDLVLFKGSRKSSRIFVNMLFPFKVEERIPFTFSITNTGGWNL